MQKMTVDEAKTFLENLTGAAQRSPPAPGATTTPRHATPQLDQAMAVVALETLNIVEQLQREIRKQA